MRITGWAHFVLDSPPRIIIDVIHSYPGPGSKSLSTWHLLTIRHRQDAERHGSRQAAFVILSRILRNGYSYPRWLEPNARKKGSLDVQYEP